MLLTCRGCGATVDPLGLSPWACPRRDAAGLTDVDHVLVLSRESVQSVALPRDRTGGAGVNPFVRYRERLGSYAAAIEAGWSDAQFVDTVGSLDDAVVAVWGSGFTVTPTTSQPTLATAIGVDGLWVKDETGNVSGSHKARHLFGLALWLAVRSPADDDARLAIASCGNAALGAGVVAAAMRRPLDVYVPVWADESVVARLVGLGANILRCERREGEVGDPCVLRMREAVAGGSLPFGCQGPDNGLTIDGGRTIGWELAEQAPGLVAVYVQMGGGALASSLARGLAEGGSDARVIAVQTEGCAPFDRAWRRVEQVGLDEAVHHRSAAMRPWESEPNSAATGILDDETYDWAGVAAGLELSHGTSVVAPESAVVRAHALAHEHTTIDADPTGTAGLAGVLTAATAGAVGVLFTGLTRR